MRNLIESLYIFGSMLIGGVMLPFMDSQETDHTLDSEGTQPL